MVRIHFPPAKSPLRTPTTGSDYSERLCLGGNATESASGQNRLGQRETHTTKPARLRMLKPEMISLVSDWHFCRNPASDLAGFVSRPNPWCRSGMVC
jgi:hypothetical protein